MRAENIRISFTILACNEHAELDILLRTLLEHKRRDDEIHVVLDEGNVTNRVLDVISEIQMFPHKYDNGHNLFVWQNKLNKDFSSQKNFAASKCKGDYIFNIDADELIGEWFINNLPELLSLNESVDVFYVPRINIVNGLTQEHIDKWRWRVNKLGWVNHPDYQMRIYKNIPTIKWVKPVHETLEGQSNVAYLPTTEEFCIMHIKEINRQEKQNAFYDTIN